MTGPARYAVGLDVGSVTHAMPHLPARRRTNAVSRPCRSFRRRGWSKGRISDQVAATESIRAAVTEAERKAHVSVESAVVGVGGTSIEGMNSRGLV